jgi:simple sugar transport system permease protein
MNDWLIVVILGQAVLAATPLVLAGLGELLAERCGVLNLGIEGLMLTGCIAAFTVTAATGSPWLGLLAAMVAAVLLGSAFALLTITARADQIVAGMAVNLVAFGASGTVWQVAQARGLDHIEHGFTRGWTGSSALSELPLFGPLLFAHYGLTPVVLALALLLGWAMARTRFGLVVTALGETPAAAAASGIAVRRWRWGAVLAGAACAGAAGAFLSIMRTHAFVPHMTGGMGFVVLALVMFGRWQVGWLVAGCLLFGVTDAVQQQFQSLPAARAVPYQVFQMLPYVVALVALAVLSRTRPGPAALGRAW